MGDDYIPFNFEAVWDYMYGWELMPVIVEASTWFIALLAGFAMARWFFAALKK